MKPTLIDPGGNLFDPQHQSRGILFLDADRPRSINGWREYQRLQGIRLDKIRRRFSNWIGFGSSNKLMHHGYSGSAFKKYKNCYTFKDISIKFRFHGFLFSLGRNFQLCVITHAEKKKEDQTNVDILESIVEIMNASEVRKAITDFATSCGLPKGG